jgi:hypothetical protein
MSVLLFSISHETLLSGKWFFIWDTRQSPLATSPSDPIKMMRIEGAVEMFLVEFLFIMMLPNIEKYDSTSDFGPPWRDDFD